MINNVLIVSNKDRDAGYQYAQKTAVCCQKLGAAVYAEQSVCDALQGQAELIPFDFSGVEESNIDLCIVLGGDGTVLNTVKRLKCSDIPLLGINAGHLGYLTQIGKEDMESVLPDLFQNGFEIDRRFLIKATLYRDGKEAGVLRALNEISLHRGSGRKVMQIGVSVNDCSIDTFYADGMLVCTPTGSTAYNLSAGGPVAQPSAPVMIITPICSHNMASPSVVTGATDTIIWQVKKTDDGVDAVLSADSGDEISVKAGDEVRITKSAQNLLLVKWGENNFYKILQQKLYNRT
ncbi:MAG: NAD(+)/NADH kinase [Oscillospiraceae bacterium]|nr:NAD(+)/NADH kinase [Oscillospiraceae bacterium]